MEPVAGSESRDDGLFDEYLDRALAGDAEDPAAFCAERGVDAPSWLFELHELVRTSDPLPAAGGGARGDGRRLGGFELVRQLGEGGMGIVYLAEEVGLGRHVALKTVRPELAASPTALARFEREARALARLSHSSIAAVHSYGESDGVRFLAMELVLGRDLDEVLADGPLPVERAIAIARDLAHALAAAHAAGVLHRDVKPGNVRLDPDGRVLLMDFGLARQLDLTEPTLTSAFAGSPAYAAPEQLTGAREVDSRTDVYGLGVTLYEMLVGQVPFAGRSVDEIMRRVLTEDPRSPRRHRPAISRDLEAVVLCAVERHPERRYVTMADFAADLDALIARRPVAARAPGPGRRALGWMRRHRVATVAIALVFVTALGLLLQAGWWHRQNRDHAQELVEEARSLMGVHGEARRAAEYASERLRGLEARLRERPLNAGEEAARQRFTRESALVHQTREEVLARVLGLLSAAQGFDPTAAGLQRAFAEMHYHSWLDLRRSNPRAAAVHFARVRELDEAGDLAEKVLGVQRVTIVSTPPGAEVHLFRWREHSEVVPGGEPRLVPVGPDGEAPRELVLRVEHDGGGLRVGDFVTSVWGRSPAVTVVRHSARGGGDEGPAVGEPCDASASDVVVEPAWQFLRKRESGPLPVEVLRGEELLRLDVAPPVDVVPTWSAYVPTAATRIGSAPISGLVLEPGSYHAVLRLPGHRDCRLPFHVDHAAEDYSRPRVFAAELVRSVPRGFVHVAGEAYGLHRYFLQRREVTNGEYLEFVNDRKEPWRWLPRRIVDDASEPAWPIADGRVRLPEDLDPELPVTGISWGAAKRYARWLPAAMGLDGEVYYGVLPHYHHLSRCAHGGDGRQYVHGAYFHPGWIKSRHARRGGGLEPAMSYPLDETAFGVFDLQGSASEWCGDAQNAISEGTRLVFGGSYLDTEPYRFQLRTYRAVPPDAGQSRIGFRVMLLERDD
ncbi:MAG: bifunctional serine/threonine-protein kinase/formylglycine-generating enzyme family protein [bacterium]|nr:bifunctional serine/threonine-protein kinase/formylglycine-generating enzyme family protein [bacterium]